MVFQLPDGFGEEDARDLCARFAAEPSSEAAICPMAGVEIKTCWGEGELPPGVIKQWKMHYLVW